MTADIEDIDVDELLARVDKKAKNAIDPEHDAPEHDAVLDLVTDIVHEDLQVDLLADDNAELPAVNTSTDDEVLTDDIAPGDLVATLDALEGVLCDLKDHLTRTTAWVDEALASIEVSRDR